jgi:arylsulfatase
MVPERSVNGRTWCGLAALAGVCALPGLWWGCGPPEAPRLVLLVTVDTLRADQLGSYGSEHGLTPNLDALARRSTVFERAFAAAPLTLPSVAGILTGRYPEELGLRTNESAVPASVETLATVLSSRGWSTGAVVGNFVLRRTSGLDRGFGQFDDAFPEREAVRRWPERPADDATDRALALVEDCLLLPGSRCFVWVHYQDPHGPYDPPGDRRARLLPGERAAPDGGQRLPLGADHQGVGAIPRYQFLDDRYDVAYYRAGYRAEIAYMDEQIGRLLAALDRGDLWRESIVVFAADHGESLGEGNVWFAHGSRLTDEQVWVPLVIFSPGRAPARRTDPVSLVDVFPTLLGLLGVTPDGAARPGRDLFAPGGAAGASVAYMATLGAAEVPSYAIVDEGFKLILAEREGVYDGRLHRLGEEDAELGAAAPQVAARLRQRLEAFRQGLARAPETRPVLTEAEREQLRGLGYLEDGAADP